MARLIAVGHWAHGSWRFLMHSQKKSNHDCFSFLQRNIPIEKASEKSLKHGTWIPPPGHAASTQQTFPTAFFTDKQSSLLLLRNPLLYSSAPRFAIRGRLD